MGKHPWKPMHSTLLARSLVAASQSWDGKQIPSYKVSSLLARQVPLSGANFQEMLLEAIEPARAPSTKRKRPRGTRKHLQPAGTQHARSRDALLKELTDIASEVIGTTVSADAPLMDAGLDSIGGTEVLTQMSKHLDMDLPQTLLFDHPTLESVVDSLRLDYNSVPSLELNRQSAHKQLPQAGRAGSRDSLLKELTGIASEVIGTTVSADVPLMESGLDSISAMEL